MAAQSIFVAFLLFAANLRKIEAFLQAEAAIERGSVRRLPRRRGTRPLSDWRPTNQSPVRPTHPVTCVNREPSRGSLFPTLSVPISHIVAFADDSGEAPGQRERDPLSGSSALSGARGS